MTNKDNYLKAVKYYNTYLSNNEDKYFRNRQAKLIYYLTQLQSVGDVLDKLNLTKNIIQNKDKLKEWADNIYEIISTDISEQMIPSANVAIKNLKILYDILNK